MKLITLLLTLFSFTSLAAATIRVVVASETPVKLKAVENVFKAHFADDTVEVISCPVDSNIPNQPVGRAVAEKGIFNRLSHLSLEGDYLVAIESYIEPSEDGWNDISLVSINGRQSLSRPVPVDAAFVTLAKEQSHEVSDEGFSTTVGQVIQKIYNIDSHDWHREEAFGGVSRECLLEEALFKALHADKIAFLKEQVQLYPNFPKEGILFEDFFPVLSNPESFQCAIDLLYEYYKNKNIDVVLGLESRGFILAAALAYKLNVGFVPVRKPGKLPCPAYTVTYQKEYGTDTLCLSQSALKPNQKVLIIDDLIATGGSAKAAIELVRLAGAIPAAFASILEIPQLNGRQSLGIESFNLLNDSHEKNTIRPPNGMAYKINLINPVVHKWNDFDAIEKFFSENGYVVVDNVSERKNREALVELIDQIIEADIPNSRRLGFLDLYHDATLANLRQDPKMYQVFSKLLETKKLWVVFDRVIFQKKEEDEDALPPHVDQNPLTHPEFFNVQAMLALRNMDETTGTLAVIPKSPGFFHDYCQWAKLKSGYVEYQGTLTSSFVGLRLKEGQLVIWDSRTTHSRYRGNATSDRYAALITFTKAKEDQSLIDRRLQAFKNGTGCNDHEAGLRATAPPRCEHSLRQNEEKLSSLGKKLYGLVQWGQE